MKDNNKQPNTLVAGRAGELVNYANPITFSLIEKIFGITGPYREGMKLFGVFPTVTKESFLECINGKVYSNIQNESQILWGNYPFKLILKEDRVVNKLEFFPKPFKKIKYFWKKNLIEGNLISRPDKTEEIADTVYKRFCVHSRRVCGQSSISYKTFLQYYKDVVFITYLYELLFTYHQGEKVNTTKYDEYVNENDYLLNNSGDLIELKLRLPNGFYLDDYKNLDHNLNFTFSGNKFVPNELPKVENVTTKFGLETKLQCMKNNMRLETNILLYFLNRHLLEIATKRNLPEISYLTLDEIESETNDYVSYESIINKRKKDFNLDIASNLPNIIYK